MTSLYVGAIVLGAVTALPPVVVSPQAGFEPLDIYVRVRAAQESRALYVAVTDSLGSITSSTHPVTPSQVRYNFEFKRLRACECEVTAYSIEPNEIRLIGSRTLIVTGRGH